MTRIGATPEPQQPQDKPIQQQQQQETQKPSVFAEFNDTDGKIDSQDVKYNTDKTSSNITKFLSAFNGKDWTASLKFQIEKLIQQFNFESAKETMQNSFNNFVQEAQQDFENFKNETQKDFNGNNTNVVAQGRVLKNEKPVGHLVPISNDDGTTYIINFADKTINKYSATKELLGGRPMTDAEKSMEAQDLIKQIHNNPDAVKTVGTTKTEETTVPAKTTPTKEIENSAPVAPKEPTGPPENAKFVNRDGINGWYALTETENGGYSISSSCNINNYRNPAARALQKGLEGSYHPRTGYNDYSVESDSKGFYFRGMSGITHSILSRTVDSKASQLAMHTAIYQDLQAKQKNGETLCDFEQNFINNYLNSLTEYGLQLNENGELEDIPVKRGRRR